MKRLTFVSLLLGLMILSSSSLKSQERPNQFSAGYGVITIDEELAIIESVISSVITVGNYNLENQQMSGAFVFTYNYALSKIVHLGGAFVYENITEDVMVSKEKKGEFKRDFYTIAAEGRFSYLNASFFQMYSGVGAGVTFNTDKFISTDGSENSDSQTHFNFQINLLGLRVGNAFGAYAELGYGYKGIVNAGISVRL